MKIRKKDKIINFKRLDNLYQINIKDLVKLAYMTENQIITEHANDKLGGLIRQISSFEVTRQEDVDDIYGAIRNR